MPALIISEALKIMSVLLDGSCMVVTPKARLASRPGWSRGVMPLEPMPPWAWASTNPGMIQRPETSICRVLAGIVTDAALPIIVIRLFSTSTTLLGITSSPFMVMAVAPTRAIRPLGRSVGARKPIGVPAASGWRRTVVVSSVSKANVCERSRWKSSGPSDQ